MKDVGVSGSEGEMKDKMERIMWDYEGCVREKVWVDGRVKGEKAPSKAYLVCKPVWSVWRQKYLENNV